MEKSLPTEVEPGLTFLIVTLQLPIMCLGDLTPVQYTELNDLFSHRWSSYFFKQDDEVIH